MPDIEEPQDWTMYPHIVVVLDESGSMAESRDTAISSLNEYLQGLKSELPGTARVTLTKFAARHNAFTSNVLMVMGTALDRVVLTNVFDKMPLSEIRTLTAADFAPNGGTPLYDAIGRTITAIDTALIIAPAPVFFTVLTDGEENESRSFTAAQIQTLISARRERGWTFTFLGVDIDAYAAGAKMGYAAGDTMSFGRGFVGASMTATTENVGRKFKTARALAASGAPIEEYAVWNTTDATYSAEDKAKVEGKPKAPKKTK